MNTELNRKGKTMSRMNLNYKEAHAFVREQRKMGSDLRWDGWDMVFWEPTQYGFEDSKGAFRKGRWGVETRISVSNDGTWSFPNRKVRRPKAAKSVRKSS